MRRLSTATRLALTSSTFAIAAGVSAPALAKAAPTTETATTTTTVSAQDVQNLPTNANTPQQIAANTGSSGGITVTGTRIRRPNLESVVPITSIQGEQFFQRGNPDVGEAL